MGIGNRTQRLIVQLGDGGDPEVFAFTCGADTFGITLKNNLGEDVALDCENPLDLPAVISRYLESQDTTVTISGRVTMEALPTWRVWADAASVKNVKILFDETLANNGGFWTVPAFLEGFEMGKATKETVTFTASIMGAGARVWTVAAA